MPEPIAANMVVKSAVKKQVGEGNLSMASKSFPVLNGRVCEMLGKAAARASANGRKTILPQDL